MLSEIHVYLERLRDLRAQVLRTLDGLDADALNWQPLPNETNSLFVLATHCIGSERGWFGSVLGGAPPTRDRAAEFRARGEDLAALRAAYAESARFTWEILAPLTAGDLDATRQHDHYGMVTVRWIILHVIEHYSEHLGQAQLTRQLWENRSARPHEI
jgi:uncharacterized damage-inducible protein DinB